MVPNELISTLILTVPLGGKANADTPTTCLWKPSAVTKTDTRAAEKISGLDHKHASTLGTLRDAVCVYSCASI